MSHLIAYFGNEADSLACALFSARSALYSRGEPGDEGFGLGFVQGGDVLLQKRPRAETAEVDLYRLAKDARAEALIARVGLAQDGSAAADDADPFRFRSWLFGSVGDLDEAAFEPVHERVLESIPTFLRRNIRGRSPSEHLFHLFLAFLHDAGILEQPTPALAAVQGALRNSLAFVDQSLVATDAPPLQLALAATNGRCFVAAGCGVPLRFLAVDGISDCPVCRERDHHGNPSRTGRRLSHEALRALVLEANGAVVARPGWREVQDRAALVAGPDRAVTISPL